jgi:hypothetical protein
MIKRNFFIISLATVFILLSGIIYYIHFLIFHDAHHIFLYLIGDLAFLPLEVLLVVVIIERILTRRETQAKLQKMNMVVGAFFSEVGNYLLRSLLECFHNKEDISKSLYVNEKWTKTDFQKAKNFSSHLPIELDYRTFNLVQLKEYLTNRREFVLTLLENPSLLEDDRFTDLLWALTHLVEELEARESLNNLPEPDLAHLAGDIRRMYGHLVSEWLDYTEHLKLHYPYLFSLVLRTHPFQKSASPLITQ